MCYALVLVMALIASPALAGDIVYLRDNSSEMARIVNEVGLWKTADAARKATDLSKVIGTAKADALACQVPPGTKAKILSKSGAVALVQDKHSLFGGCKGYVRSDFLSQE